MSEKIETKIPLPELNLQQSALALGALRRVGNVVTRYTLDSSGDRIFDISFKEEDFNRLVERFREDPKDSLAYVRNNLFAINQDKGMSPGNRRERLSRYIDNYAELTVALDKAAFGEKSSVRSGTPRYIPHGLIDMGGEASLDSKRRSREQIRVDKPGIIKKHKSSLMDVFSMDVSGDTGTEIKKKIVSKLLYASWRNLPYDYSKADKPIGEGVIDLHTLDKGVCRHIALTYQVLAQACGLTSELMKCHRDGGRHAANQTRINHQWYIVDPTIPELVLSADRQVKKMYAPTYKVDQRLAAGETRQVASNSSDKKITFAARDDMFWRIDA